MNARGPSEHLTWAELACKDGTAYPHRWRTTRALALARAFEAVRAAAGNRPITVLSAYRTPEWNRKVGGARASQHTEGRALDLRPPAGMSLEVFYRLARAEAEHAGIRGISRYPTFVHIDVRPSEKLIVWQGRRAWAEVL